MPVVRREPDRQQLLFRHGAARVVPEAVEELGLPHSKKEVGKGAPTSKRNEISLISIYRRERSSDTYS